MTGTTPTRRAGSKATAAPGGDEAAGPYLGQGNGAGAFLRLLSQASRTLGASLDYATTLQQVARLVVPALADWCVIDIVDNVDDLADVSDAGHADGAEPPSGHRDRPRGPLRRVAVAHVDPAKEPILRGLVERYPPGPRRPHPMLRALETGRPELIVSFTDADAVRLAQDDEHLRIVREVTPRSTIFVPLVARGRALGVLSLVYGDSGRAYGDADVPLAMELAGRAALAIDTARLARQAQAAAREAESSRAFVTSILQTVGALVVVLDREGRIVRFSRACELATGYAAEEVSGRAVWDVLLPPEDVAPVQAVFAQLVAGRFPNQHENDWLTRDGGRRRISWRNTATVDETGGVRYVVGTGIDVTEQRRAERERAESLDRERAAMAEATAQARFGALLEAAPDAIVVVDRDGRIILVNQQTEALFGYSREELIGQPADKLVPARLRAAQPVHRAQYVKAPARRTMGTGMDLLGRRRDGSEFPVEVNLSPVESEGDLLIIVDIRDITERQRMQDALRESERTIRSLYEVTSAPELDFDARVQALLAMGCERFGLPIGILAQIEGDCYEVAAVHTAPGTPVTIAKGDLFSLGQTYCRDTLRSPEPVGFAHAAASAWSTHPCYEAFRLEAYLATPVRVGRRVYGTLNFSSPTPRAVPFTPADMDVLRLMAQWLGGELARQEAEAERLAALAREAEVRAETERLKDEFFANLSHDLRAPVAAIKASLGVVLENAPPGMPPALHRLLANADEATDRLERLVADLLELTRLEAGRLRLERAPHDLRALVLRTAGVVEALAQTRGQQLEVIVPPEPVVVEVDAPRLERVLLNLLSNAHTYGREGGAILVRLVPGPEAVEVAVADDGPGIPPDEHGRIFERFYRVQGSPAAAGQRRAPASGSGLGLAIARAFVELHGGRLWVESTPGQGATFRLTVPNRPS